MPKFFVRKETVNISFKFVLSLKLCYTIINIIVFNWIKHEYSENNNNVRK
jgi:hypothetical protein